jgi:hypothetical protein
VGAAVTSLTFARVSALALALGAAFGALATLQPVSDSDLFWHLETGRRTLGGDLPRADVFSWTVAGGPVLVDQWLGDLLLAVARALGDWRGVLALRALAVAALVATVIEAARHARPGRPIVVVAAALPAIALSRFAWTDRPELLGLVCFAVLVRLLRGGDRELLWTIPLLLIWSQLHGSFALGLGLILASCAARALESTRDRWRFAPIAAFAVLVTLLTPSGLAAWTSSGGHFLIPPRFVAEEGVPDARTLPGLLFLVTLGLVVATAMLGRRATLREAALLVPVAFVALTAARHTPLLAIAAAPFFASAWPDPLARWRTRDERTDERAGGASGQPLSSLLATRARGTTGYVGHRARWAQALVEGLPGRSAGGLVAIASLAVLGVAIALADAKVDESAYPKAALAALPSGPGVLNQYDWGGYLIEFAPSTPVFIDGRLFPYVPGVLDDYRAVIGAHPGWESVVVRRGVTAMLVRPTDAIAVRAPERGWRVAYADAIAVVLVR